MSKTKIDWADMVWNPVTGCSKISEGCQNCYAERMTKRLQLMAPKKYSQGFAVKCHHEALQEPLKIKKSQRIFVCSMSDLFHNDVPFEFIDRVFAVMALCPQHTFIVLTKRPQRMAEYCQRLGKHASKDPVSLASVEFAPEGSFFWKLTDIGWALPNVWLGVTAENQARADERIPILLQIPAAVRFVSIEPMLGPIDLGFDIATCKCCFPRWKSRWIRLNRHIRADFPLALIEGNGQSQASPGLYRAESNKHGALHINGLGVRPSEATALAAPDWIICGGETGPGARPMHPDWVRSLRDQCAAANVPFFFKQWGEWFPDTKRCFLAQSQIFGNTAIFKIGKKAAGHMLDGKEHRSFPKKGEV